MRRRIPIRAVVTAGMLGLLATSAARAGTATYDFTADPVTGANALQVYQVGFQDSAGTQIYWKDAGGNPGGFLGLTWPIGSSTSIILFPDLDPGQTVTSFKLETDLRLGNPQQNVRAADGFSINFVRIGDPVLDNPNSSSFATPGAVEMGTTTGISIIFDTWAGNTWPSGEQDFPNFEPQAGGIIIRVDNQTIGRFPMPVYSGACADATSIQTGPRNLDYWTHVVNDVGTINNAGGADIGNDEVYKPASWADLCWQHLSVEVDQEAKVTVIYKGVTLLDHFQSSFFPSGGRIVLAGRTGGADEHAHFDNLTLTTQAAANETQPPTDPTNLVATVTGARRVALSWDRSFDRPSTNGIVAYNVERNGVVITGAPITATTFEDWTAVPSTTYTYRVQAQDVAGNKSGYASASITTVAEAAGTGWALANLYTNITGATWQNLIDATVIPEYPNTPYRSVYASGLNLGSGSTADNFGDNYLARIAGTLTVPSSGQWRFFVRSDDASGFWLNPAGAALPDVFEGTQIASEKDCCDAFAEPGADENNVVGGVGDFTFPTSEPVNLTAGTRYGFVYLVKEGGGGDFGQVAMRKEGDTTPAAQLTPINGIWLAPPLGGDPVGASVAITREPASTNVVANEALTLSTTSTFASPYLTTAMAPVYQWYKDGTPIPHATGQTFSIPVVTAADAGAYTFFISVPGAQATSAAAQVTVSTDTKLPTLVEGGTHGSADFTHVTVRFSEPVTDPSATTAGNYAITPAVAVTGATRVDQFTVQLTTAPQTPNTVYTLTVNNVRDNANNAIAASSTVLWSSFVKVGEIAGTVLAEIYDGAGGDVAGAITGTVVTNLTLGWSGYPASPDITTNITAFNSRMYYADDLHENFGARMTGTITVTETGNYRFFITSDDSSELWLNKTGTSEAGLEKIAEETGCCNAFTEPDSPRTSAWIPLTAGTQYLLRGIYKEGGGGDYLQVAWRKEGDPRGVALLAPLPGSYDPWAGAPIITTQPQGAAVAAGGNATFSVVAGLGTRPFRYQWQSVGPMTTYVDIPGATDSTLTINNVDLSKITGYRVVVSNDAGTATSQVVVLTLANSFVIEAEDFDHSGGQHVAAADTMPYTGFAYDGLSATYNVDYHNGNNDSITYRRGGDLAVGGQGASMDNVNGNVMSVNRGAWSVTTNYKIGWIDAGDWHNYTRAIPGGTYTAFAALSYGGTGASQLKANLQQVTSGLGTTNQTVVDLGAFDQAGSGDWGRNNLVPLKNAGGGTATFDVASAVTTLRMAHTSGDFDWFMLVPAAPSGPVMSQPVVQPDGKVVLSWSGGGTLQVAPSLSGPWVDQTGVTSPLVWTPPVGTTEAYARIKQ